LKNFIYIALFLYLLQSCGGDNLPVNQKEPKKVAQWINPVFYNNDFENELNFPLWFNDSFVRSHEIYKITKRVYPRIVGDTSEINSYNEAIPKEKIEYFFDKWGCVEKIIVSSYFDDREISKATFVYEGRMFSNGYRKVKVLPFVSLTKNPIKDEFTTDFFQDKTHQFSILSYLKKTKKYTDYVDLEKGNHLYMMFNHKYWGPLSVDSILNPTKEDWIVLGTIKRPVKRYKVENTVKETQIYNYTYWNSGVLKSRTKKLYPFEYKRSFQYNSQSIWNGFVDSTFSEGMYISHIENKIFFDKYKRPIEVTHFKKNEDVIGFFYKETYHYRTHKNDK
jgi:hypothetical protein